MPLPPPPAEALIITGKPTASAAATAAASVSDGVGMAGDGRDARFGGELLRGDLVAHRADGMRVRPDEGDARRGERLGEVGALGEEAVAGMDRVGAGRPAGRDDLVDDEIRGRGLRRPDMHGLVRGRNMNGLAVGIVVDGDGGDAEPPRGLGDADGDLAAVGDQNLPEHLISRASPPPCRAARGTVATGHGRPPPL